MLGLMVMSYSIPLHFTEVTEVVSLGVPWWSGLTVSLCESILLFHLFSSTFLLLSCVLSRILILWCNVVFLCAHCLPVSWVCALPVHDSGSGRYHLGQTLHLEDCESIDNTYTHMQLDSVCTSFTESQAPFISYISLSRSSLILLLHHRSISRISPGTG